MSAPWRDIYIYTQDPQIVISIWGIFRSKIPGWTVGFQIPFFIFLPFGWLHMVYHVQPNVSFCIQRLPFCSQIRKVSKNKIFKYKGYHLAAYVVAHVEANKILKKKVSDPWISISGLFENHELENSLCTCMHARVQIALLVMILYFRAPFTLI